MIFSVRCLKFFSIHIVSILIFVLSSAFFLHADVTLDGTLGGPQLSLTGPDFQIEAEYGKTIGTNLFHSFGEFSIENSQSAVFSGPADIKNIVGRVTGGSISSIDGHITSDMPLANLYLLNPSGFLFGPNASLAVNGSFHVSTADYLSLGNEGVFYADPIKTSILHVDPPTAFGFLSASPEGITVQDTTLTVGEGKTVSIIGGDLEFIGKEVLSRSQVIAPGGRIDIVSVSSPGEVIPDYSIETPGLSTESCDTLGSIKMDYANINAGGNGGGTIFIRGGSLVVDTSYIYASTQGNSGTTGGNGIDINISGDMILDNPYGNECTIGTNVFGYYYDESGQPVTVQEDSGGIRISADHLELKNGASIRSVAFLGSAGGSGDIVLNTNTLLIENSATIQAGTGGSEDSGNILINTGTIDIRDNGFVWTNAFGGTGNSGGIDITADHVFLSNERYPGASTGIVTQTYWSGYQNYPGSAGNAGNITLKTNHFEMLPSTQINSATYYLGQGGNIDIAIAEKGSITGMKNVTTGIIASAGSQWAANKGGNINITAGELQLDSHASITAATYSTTDSGNITLEDVGTLEINNGSYISTIALFGTGGSAGDVFVHADNIRMSGLESTPEPFTTDFNGITSSSGYGNSNSGTIIIETDNIHMDNRSTITSTSYSSGEGGRIAIEAHGNTGLIELLNGSGISASAFGTGYGGQVEISADHIRVSGVHPEIYTEGTTGAETLAPSGIASQAGVNGGNGGSLDIEAQTIEVLDGALMATDTFGTGKAGDINIVSDHLVVSGENAAMRDFFISIGHDVKHAASEIVANASSSYIGDDATGDGGSINISTKELLLEETGRISTDTTSPGQGGNINILAQSVSISSSASISAMSSISEQAGKAGNITIETKNDFHMDDASLLTSAQTAQGGNIRVEGETIELVNHTTVSAQSSGSGDAGSVYLGGQQSFFMDKSVVSTEALQADGGNIKIFAEDLVHLVDSLISASVGGGVETEGGNVSIDPEFVVLKNSQIIANAYEGAGGNIDIISDVFLADPDSLIDASSSLGIDGQVDIQSPITHVNSLVKPLSKDFRSVVALLRQPCMARVHKGEYSSFMIKGRTSLPVEPGRFLSSPLSIQ